MNDKVVKLDANELENVNGGFNYYVVNELERYKYDTLSAICDDPNISAIDFNRAVDQLVAFCKEMKAKYGDVVDPFNLLG